MDDEQLKKAYEAVELLKALNLPVSEEQKTAIAVLEKEYLKQTVVPNVKKELAPFLSSFVNRTKLRIDYSPNEGLSISIVGEQRPSQSETDGNVTNEGRDRTKYAIDGGLPQNKRRFVLEVVRKYVDEHPGITIDELERVFPSHLSNSPLNGVVRSYESVTNRMKTQPDLKNRFLLEPEELITLSDGTKVTVYNQWGHAFSQFLELAQKMYIVECFG